MKLLVLAQTPPPLHGQSVMVQTMLDGLAQQTELELFHVNLPLSRDAPDIGRIRPGKLRTLLQSCRRARTLATTQGIEALYYIPAPAKRSALCRDWIVMSLCRSTFRRVVLHWHAPGLGAWLQTHARPAERWLTRRLLGRADLSIVLAEALRADAAALDPRQTVVVPNGVADPCPGFVRPRQTNDPFVVLFLGLCSADKGLFDAAAAVLAANRLAGTSTDTVAFSLIAAGPFSDPKTQRRFGRLIAANPSALCYAGEVSGDAKHALLAQSRALCLPTRYPHEGQPLVLLEAMAYDLPIVATRWRAIPNTVPIDGARLVEPGDIPALAQALLSTRALPPAANVGRSHYLQHFTCEQHLAALATAFTRLA